MTLTEIKNIMKILTEAEENLIDLPLEWIEEAAEKDILLTNFEIDGYGYLLNS